MGFPLGPTRCLMQVEDMMKCRVRRVMSGLAAAWLMSLVGCGSGGTSPGPATSTGQAGGSVHYYFYMGRGMLRCPGRIAGYTTQAACDALGRSQTENGPVNQVGLTCDTDPAGCIVGDTLMVTATDRCSESDRSVRVRYKSSSVTVRIVDRTPGNGGFDLGLDPYIDLGLYTDFNIGVSGPQDLTYECLR